MTTRGVELNHLWGTRDRPLLPHELVRRKPILATAEMPPQLAQLSRTRSVFVSTLGCQEPATAITKIETIGPRTIWRINHTDMSEEPVGMPGKTAIRIAPQQICSEIDPSVSCSG